MHWWDLYFGELYLRMSETMLNRNQTAQEVTGVLAMLNLEPRARILDLCCGQGRHAVPLAQAGYRVTGLDRSTYLLRQAQQSASEALVDIHWVRGDMRRLPLSEEFDACINLFTAFGYFDDEAENLQVLHQVFGVLRSRGVFLLDVCNRDYYLMNLWPRAWRRQGAAVILEETSFDPISCRFNMTFTWVEGAQRQSLTHSVRYYTVPELLAMLRAAGLVPVGIYGDFDGSHFDLGSKRLIVVTRKP
jgi:SAM-dependent methyltransferase